MTGPIERAARRVGLRVVDVEAQLAEGVAAAKALDIRFAGAADVSKVALATAIGDAYVDADTIEALAFLRYHDPAVLDRWLLRWRSLPGACRAVDRLAKIVKRGLEPAKESGAKPSAPKCSPVGYVVPDRVVLTEDGTALDGERVALGPVFVTGRFIDADTGRRAIGVGWASESNPAKLEDEVMDRAEAFDPRGLAKLAARGAPVGMHNARAVATILDASEVANRGRLPLRRTAKRLGWFDGGFLCGDRWVGDPAKAVRVRVDDGARQVVDAVRAGGTWRGWLASIEAGVDSPSVWLAIYASIASVLLEPLAVPQGYILDFSGETSRGKTTALRVAASVWGVPTEAGLLQSWSLTAARAEGVAGLLSAIPLCLDDTKQARTPEAVSALLYAHSYGQGRGRARPDGLRVSARWRSVLLSTGEQPAVSFSNDAGSRARTICLVGSPLESAAMAECLTLGVLEHYGHLGPMALEALLADLEHWRAVFRNRRGFYAERLAKAGAVARRLSWFVALLDVAREVAEVAGLPCPPATCQAPIDVALAAAKAGGVDADRPAEAVRAVHAWAISNPASWWGRHAIDREGSPVIPYGGWLGRWKRDPASALEVLPAKLEEYLDRRGFDRGVIDRWHERGWLIAPKGRRRDRVRLGDGSVRVYRIRFEVLRDVCIGGGRDAE